MLCQVNCRLKLCAAMCCAFLSAQSAQAQVPIVTPEERPPILAGEVDVALALPTNDRRLCPKGSRCILGSGLAVGASFQRRWRTGVALGIGYSLWLLDANSVYELTVVQSLGVMLQYAALPSRRVHPLIRVSAAPALIGDSFAVDSFGVTAKLQAGAEFELTSGTAVIASVGWSAFSFRRFTTKADGVVRGTGRAFDGAATLELGYVFYGTPGHR